MAFSPVCIGSCTDFLSTMPGAIVSIKRVSLVAIGPLPSIGFPRGSTTLPSSPSPTGISAIRFVRLTSSPSLMVRSLPNITTPTLSS